MDAVSRAAVVEQDASRALAVLEHAIVIEARVLVLMRQRGAAVVPTERLAELVRERDVAQEAHVAAMRAYRAAMAAEGASEASTNRIAECDA